MATGLIRDSDLPFDPFGANACAAARAGEALMRVSFAPAPIEISFIGTGTANVPANAARMFDAIPDAESFTMQWLSNKFVGHHWLLGDFSIDLFQGARSTGTIEKTVDAQVINRNSFFFDFKFKRFPRLNMRNTVPIVNSAVIQTIPPVGSVFEIEGQTRIDFLRGDQRLMDDGRPSNVTVEFDRCAVTVFPARNVDMAIKSSVRSGARYDVIVNVRNTSPNRGRFAYFNVIHFDGLTPSSDYGFMTLDAGADTDIRFSLESSVPDRDVTVPFFAGLYQPKELQGSASLPLTYRF